MRDSSGPLGPLDRRVHRPRGLAAAALLAGWLAAPAAAVTLEIDPRASFHRLDPTDTLATAAVAIELAPRGILPGDFLELDVAGDWQATSGGADTATLLVGVFSSSATLAAGTNLDRVTGAIDAGVDVATDPTSPGMLATDIAEDFLIDDTRIEVPPGATHLFVAVADERHGDNSDPDFDLGVSLRERPAALVGVDPRKTYLRLDPAEPLENLNPVPIALATLGIEPGDPILLRRLGDWAQSSGGADTETGMIAVFSGSSFLEEIGNPNRVRAALDAGTDVATPATSPAGLPTDIPEDFAVTDAEITVPTGATHLFVSVPDTGYATNADPDGDLEILLVPEPAGELLAIAALGAIALLMRSEQRAELRRHRRR